MIISTDVDLIISKETKSVEIRKMQDRKVLNKRNTETKEKVHNALLTKLEMMDINRITILELCILAGINRTTFYNHYSSQFDVLNEIIQEYLENTSILIQTKLKEGSNFKECFVEALRYIRENTRFLKLLFSSNNLYLLSLLKDVSLPHFDQMIVQRAPREWSIEKKKASAVFVLHGVIGILVDWIRSGCIQSEEEEADLILSILGKW